MIGNKITKKVVLITGNAAVDGELLGVEFTKQTNSGSLQVSWFTDGLVVGKKVSGN